eukprot:3887675-Amphidinium_carterae.1
MCPDQDHEVVWCGKLRVFLGNRAGQQPVVVWPGLVQSVGASWRCGLGCRCQCGCIQRSTGKPCWRGRGCARIRALPACLPVAHGKCCGLRSH